ncbi:MAG: (2Fe-2S) ferredoxin domain-containing protein [Candidatus Marinimicrobia bacterium]|nr:(2Fe-2S) ferredoxin domain-containing protein [Candidatus Neomarinimicrobiota bacterium]
MPKLNIADLKKIKDRIEGTTTLRGGTHRVKITVHMGTCGIAAGARKIMNVLLKEIETQGIKDIILTSSGCAGLCNREPMATVEIKGEAPVKYIDLDEEKTRKIFNNHVISGNIIVEYALARGSETAY